MSKDLKYAANHINKIIIDLQKENKDLRVPGSNERERTIAINVYAAMWLGALEQKPNNPEAADHFIKIIITTTPILESRVNQSKLNVKYKN